MMLPSKHIPEDQSLLAVGAVLLRGLLEPQTISSLWDWARSDGSVATFERFVLALDFLYVAGAVDFKSGLLRRGNDAASPVG